MNGISLINDLQSKLINLPKGAHFHKKMEPEYRKYQPCPDFIIKAAVLILLYDINNLPKIVLIKRTVKKNDYHSGQISLPGGKFEPEDKDLSNTAIRETKEELGIKDAKIEIIGKLTNIIIPLSKYEVYPFVGYSIDSMNWKPQPKEVNKIIEVQVQYFKNPIIKYEQMSYNAEKYIVPFYYYNEYKIWGATAMILSEFSSLL